MPCLGIFVLGSEGWVCGSCGVVLSCLISIDQILRRHVCSGMQQLKIRIFEKEM